MLLRNWLEGLFRRRKIRRRARGNLIQWQVTPERLELRTLLSGVGFVMQTGASNPTNGITFGTTYTAPQLGDLDADGDLDLIVGDYSGAFSYLKNTGTSTAPVYTPQTGSANPLNGQDVGSYSKPALGDLDDDGDLDLLVGKSDGTFAYFQNTGTPQSPVFTLRTGSENPLNGQDAGFFVAPALDDLDGDGDLDLLVGKSYGTFVYYKNIGTPSAPLFSLQSGASNPLNAQDVGAYASPAFGDIDGDGDLDLVAGTWTGQFYYFLNTGTSIAPFFLPQTGTANPLNELTAGGRYASPALGDIDGDGDLDLFAGNTASSSSLRMSYFKHVASDLQLTQSVSDTTPMAGNELVFSVTLTNIGPDITSGVQITYNIPAALRDVTVVATTGNVTGSVWAVNALPAVPGSNTAVLTIRGTVIDGAAGRDIVSTAEIISSLLDPDSEPNNHLVTEDDQTTLTAHVVNTSPVLHVTSASLGTVVLGIPENPGVSVQDFINSAGTDLINDADLYDPEGIAVYGATQVHGTWQYSVDRGAHWSNFGTVTPSAARLLAANELTRIRYVPDAGASGQDQLQLRAWDQSSGTSGGLADVTANGGSTAFSTASLSAAIDVSANNDAPVLNSAGNPALNPIFENAFSNSGTLVSRLIASMQPAGGLTDTQEFYGPRGLAIIGADSSHGVWQYSLDNGNTWTNLGAVSNTAARLLAADDATRLRLVPAVNFKGNLADVINFRAWDRTAGLNGNVIDATINGGSTSLSSATETASIHVRSGIEYVPQTGPSENPFAEIGADRYTAPVFGDLDGDGDLDLIVADYEKSGTLRNYKLVFYKNDGTTDSPQFVRQDGTNDPFIGQNTQHAPALTLGDLDGDGDLDLIVGHFGGQFQYFKNIGTSTSPLLEMQEGTANLLNGEYIQGYSTPSLGDLDGDGDLDMVAGNQWGSIFFFENLGSATHPAFRLSRPNYPPQLLSAGTYFASPVLKDLDGNGTLDLIVGSGDDNILYFKNTGTTTVWAFSRQDGSANPFDKIYTGFASHPAFGDMDGDGDLDLLVGRYNGLDYLKNTGTAANPYFSSPIDVSNPLHGTDLGENSTPALANIDFDDRPDLVSGNSDGTLTYFRNTGTVSHSIFSPQTGADNLFDGLDFGADSTPAFSDINGDRYPDLIVGNSDGTLAYVESTISYTSHGDEILQYTLRTGTANPLNGMDVGASSAPALGDLDGDGDFDLIAGNADGMFFCFLNVGTSTVPVFTLQSGAANPLNGQDAGENAKPALLDLDGDGDLDLLVGNSSGTIAWYLNQGTRFSPIFVRELTNTLQDVDVGTNSAPTWVDLNQDGAVDLVVGNQAGTFNYFSLSTPALPSFVKRTGDANPFHGQETGDWALLTPELADLNGDGLLDLVVGTYGNHLQFFLNTGSASVPVFTQQTGTANPFNGILASPGHGKEGEPTLADLDGDGDLDLFFWDHWTGGNAVYYKNTGDFRTAIFTRQADENNPLNGIYSGPGSVPMFGDLDGDDDLDLLFWKGEFIYYENTGTVSNPSFVERSGPDRPTKGVWLGEDASPTLGDLDGDGDLDIVAGDRNGDFICIKNVGSQTYPRFDVQPETLNPFNSLKEKWGYTSPTLGDLDGDGDLDMVAGLSSTEIESFLYFESITSDLQLMQAISASSPPVPGQQITFTVTLTNSGTDEAAHIQVKDLLPAGFSGVTITPSAGTYSGGYWTLPSLSAIPGQNTATLTITGTITTAAIGKDLRNIAEVTSNRISDLDSILGNHLANEDDQTTAVVHVNAAPTLNAAGAPVFPSITEDQSPASNAGMLVTALISGMGPSGGIADIDPASLQGIAVYAVNNTNGKWQFSTNSGGTWADFGTPSTGAARLLASNASTKIRFVPNANFYGNSTISFVAWDQSTGVNGSTTSVIARGGATPFSATAETATITVTPVNDAPVLDNTGSPVLTAIAEDNLNSTGTLISTLLGSVPGLNMLTDADASPVEGIAVYAVNNTNGKWQFSTNGGTNWTDFGTPSASSARLLAWNGTTRVRFIPNANFNGTSTISFVGWDQTAGTNGGTASVSTRGGSTPFSAATEIATITVTPINDAPVLNNSGSPVLTSITEDNVSNQGNLVSSILNSVAGLNMVTDLDAAPVEGIAVYAVNNTNGKWQFSTNSGTNWTDFGNPSSTAARLLAADATTKIRFVPNANFHGNSTISFVAWDQSSGTNGGTASVSTRGGTTPFSALTESATITVTPVNDAPVLNNSGSPTLPSITEDKVNNTGTLVSTLINSVPGLTMITDVDAAAVKGLAVYSVNNTNGKWQFSTDNGTNWTDFGTPSANEARLLAYNATTRVRFLPNANFHGSSTIGFAAWDQTSGTNGGTASISTRGGKTAFSAATESAIITVTPVNDAPVLNNSGSPTLTSISRNAINNAGTRIADLLASVPGLNIITDADAGALEGIAVYSAATANGVWQFSTNNGSSWTALGTVSATSARLLAADATTRLRFVPNTNFTGSVSLNFCAWDRTTGTNGGTASISSRGGSTAFSAATEFATLTVTP